VRTIRAVRELRERLAPERRAGRTIGLVPTMGAFHDGHLSLIRRARSDCDVVVVSLFVNPTQFAPSEDLDAYPRDEARDRDLARTSGVDLLFVPTADEVYPAGFQTWVDVEQLGAELEGVHRPGHFRAVATVCLKLFNIVRPQLVFFGQKDAQQVAVVKRMVRDLNVDVDVRVVPTVRDEDGLALSSRNTRLTPDERRRALALPGALATKDAARARELLQGLDVDYVEVADFEPRVLAAAVRIGDTRLIDNVVLDGSEGVNE
jgi:pantoate--beta-alanine ligase